MSPTGVTGGDACGRRGYYWLDSQ